LEARAIKSREAWMSEKLKVKQTIPVEFCQALYHHNGVV
jgi:hypothetical protein